MPLQISSHALPPTECQRRPASPKRHLPHGTWGHSRERSRVGTREPQSAASGAALRYPLALSTSLIPLRSVLRMGHGLVSAESCLLGTMCMVLESCCLRDSPHSFATSSLLQQVTNPCPGRAANVTRAAAHIPRALGLQTVPSAHVLRPGRDPARCHSPRGMCVGRVIPGERSPASDAAHGKGSSSSHVSDGTDAAPLMPQRRAQQTSSLCLAVAGRSFCPNALKCRYRVPRNTAGGSAQSSLTWKGPEREEEVPQASPCPASP